MSIGGWTEGELERFVQDRQDPRLQGLLGTALLRSASGDPLRLACGVVTLAFVASQTPTPVVVDHGLGATPIAVVLTATTPAFTGAAYALDADSFTADGLCTISTTDNRDFFWIAVG